MRGNSLCRRVFIFPRHERCLQLLQPRLHFLPPVHSKLSSIAPLRFSLVLKPRKTPSLFFHRRCRATSAMAGAAAAAAAATVIPVKDKIDLTEKETLIFKRLLDVLRHFELDTQLRVAGGWVRDKLLGKDCYDIDIAIDNMLGREFCEKVNEYLSNAGEEVQGIGVIQCNPDQSKHLETARMRLYDEWIDFVNLRAEDYCETSRIPTMRFGTAEEDAYRRDLTINSLFYNINTSLVEDFTGRGITDLKSGRIVTPLPPKETFLDDPLRVLRAIRFGARFDFTLDEALKEAASSLEVRTAIADKISRERVGHEVDLMVSGNQPVKAVSYMCDLQLFWVVFSLPPDVKSAIPDGFERKLLSYMDAAWNLIQSIGSQTLSEDQRRICLYASLFLQIRGNEYEGNKRKMIPAVDFIFRNSLKLKAKDAEMVISIHQASEKFHDLISFISHERDVETAEVDWYKSHIDVPVSSKLRILAGLLLREMKDLWRITILVATLLHPGGTEFLNDDGFLEKGKEVFHLVEEKIQELGLDRVWEVKPLVAGKEIMNVLNLKPGPDVKQWLDKIVEWQLAHPGATSDECLEWMRESSAKRVKTE